MGPKTVANLKTLFHALTAASAAIAAYGSLVPPKYAIYLTIASSVISGALNILTRIYPELIATATE